MKKVLLFCLTCFSSLLALAQTPTYYVGPATGGPNSWPFNPGTGGSSHVQLLYKPTNFPTAPSGLITDIYFRPSNSVTNTYTSLVIQIGYTTLTGLTSGTWNTGLTTVYTGSPTITSVGGNWVKITLTTPFQYDNTRNMIVDVNHASTASGMTLYYGTSSSGNTRMYGAYTSTSSGGADASLYDFGFDLLPKKGMNNASVDAAASPNGSFCSGNQSVQVVLKNKGFNRINNVRVYWELDGVPQPYITYTGLIDTIGSVAGNAVTATLGNVTYSNIPRTIKAYTSIPNGIADTVNNDDTLSFTKRSSPLASITAAGPTVFCTGGVVNVTLNAVLGTNYTYKWKLNGSFITPPATGSSYTATTAGDYTLQVDSGTCSNTSAIVRVDNLAMPQPTVTPTGYVAFCDNDSVVLNANANISGATYQWQFNGANIPGATNASIAAKIPGNYLVLTNKFSCTAASPGLNVNQVSPPSPTIYANGNMLATNASFVSYQWYINNTTPISGETDFFIIPKQAGDYSVMVSNGGCSAMSPRFTVTPDMLSVISQNNPAAINVYPNPVKDVLHVSSPVNVHAQISSISGSIISEHNNAKDINVSMLPAGVYIIKLTDGAGTINKMQRFTKSE